MRIHELISFLAGLIMSFLFMFWYIDYDSTKEAAPPYMAEEKYPERTFCIRPDQLDCKKSVDHATYRHKQFIRRVCDDMKQFEGDRQAGIDVGSLQFVFVGRNGTGKECDACMCTLVGTDGIVDDENEDEYDENEDAIVEDEDAIVEDENEDEDVIVEDENEDAIVEDVIIDNGIPCSKVNEDVIDRLIDDMIDG